MQANPLFTVIIPARYNSTRLPGKALADINGKPMVQHVYERAQASGAHRVIVATDDDRIVTACQQFSAEACMTGSHHRSGTERITEAVSSLDLKSDEIVIGVQGDEPLIPPQVIYQLAEDLTANPTHKIASVYEKITDQTQLFDPNVVKVILNHNHDALYFSRAPIPWQRGAFDQSNTAQCSSCHYRHVGIYGYRAQFLADYTAWQPAEIEKLESLEQLRVLWHGSRIHMIESQAPVPSGVDTQQDLTRVRHLLESKP